MLAATIEKEKMTDQTSAGGLVTYLSQKAVHHKYYKYYAPKHYIDTILREEAVFLSDGENWNDVRDKERLNDDNRYKRFALCLSYSCSENVAMWMLYAGNDGCMIDYPQKVITAILNSDCVYAGAFSRETGTFETQISIGLDGFRIDAYDVVYFAEAKKEPNTFYYVKRSDESSSEFRRDIIEKLSYQKKTLPWSYENECRIVVSVDKQKYKKIAQIHSLKITMPKGIQKELINRTYQSPNSNVLEYQPSKMAGLINWNLCEHCKKTDSSRLKNEG